MRRVAARDDNHALPSDHANMHETPPQPAEPATEPAAEPTPQPVQAVELAAPEAAAAAEPAPEPSPAPAAAPAVPELSPAACAAKLAELFPALFGAGRALPIKLRIQADIQQRAPGLFTKKSLSIFLHRHTTSTAYLKALAQAPARLDLDGQPAGEVAAEHREAAAAELARRLAIVQERRAAERQAQRARPAPADGAAPAAPVARPERTDRPPRQQRPPRPQGDRSSRPQGDRPPRSAREQAPRPPRQDALPRPPRPAMPAAEAAPPREPLTPEQAAEWEARRSRAQLLRAYESSTLTRANFCALKGMKEDALEALLAQARAERGEPAAKGPAGRPASR